jgi:hypothetical protein
VVQAAVGWQVPVSVDTCKPAVMQAALDAGADIINDIWALRHAGAAEVVAAHGQCGVCLMHMHAEPATMQVQPMVGAALGVVKNFLQHHASRLGELGVASARILLDPGIGFGKTVAQKMIPRGHGNIINICSVQSELGRSGIAPYTASKGAVKMLTKGMAIDWGQFGINVNGLGPGYFKTELNQKLVEDAQFSSWLIGRTPSRRWGDMEDLGGAAVFLASDAARFVNGHILYVDGGVTATL